MQCICGKTDTELTAGKTGYTNLKGMIPIKTKESCEAQQTNTLRDATLVTFVVQFMEFKKHATLALSSTPQLKVKLGWKE